MSVGFKGAATGIGRTFTLPLRHRRLARSVAVALAVGLIPAGGCTTNSDTGTLTTATVGAAAATAGRQEPRASQNNAPIVTVSEIVGPPTEISVRLRGKLMQAASEAQVLLVANGGAEVDYVVSGRVSIASTQGGSSVTAVWDVFDGKRRRVGRSEASQSMGGPPTSQPWKNVSDEMLLQIARQAIVAAQLSRREGEAKPIGKQS